MTGGYTCPATLGVTIVPSGSTTTKNFFIGPAILDCSTCSLVLEESFRTTPERVHPPDAMRFRILGMATRIAATITDKRNKAILYIKLYGLPCRLDAGSLCRLTRLTIFISLNMRRTRSGDQDGFCDIPCGEAQRFDRGATAHQSSWRWVTQKGPRIVL